MEIKYALVDGERREPERGLLAKCPICETRMFAKCGNKRAKHWAHYSKRTCDPWWENKTEWHRAWQEKFPGEWREFPQTDPQSGEKHIADVRTIQGLVIEFQHSHLDSQERGARESFYKNMFWVVNGTRLKRDYPRFLKGFGSFLRSNKQDFFGVPNPEKCLPVNWLNSPVSVFFDFLGEASTDPPDQMQNVLWQLLPGRNDGKAVIVAVSRTRFVEDLSRPPQVPQPPAQQTVSKTSQQIPRVVLPVNFLRELQRELYRRPTRRRFNRF
jgi:hypothetical protein